MKTAEEVLQNYDLLPESGEPVNRVSLPKDQLLMAMEEYAEEYYRAKKIRDDLTPKFRGK